MKAYVKYVIAAAVAGLGVFLFYLSAVSWGQLLSTKDKAMFFLEQPLSVQDAEETVRKSEEEKQTDSEGDGTETMPEFCIWGQKDAVTLTNKNLFREAQANAILLCGNPEVLFEDCRLPARKDSQGCLIDEAVAWELFGSTQVVGKEISYDGKSYVVRNVIAGENMIFAFQVSKAAKSTQEQTEESNSLNRITMQKPEDQSIVDLSAAWGNRYGMEVTVLDVELLRGIGGFCVLPLPITLCICFLCYLFHEWRQQKKLALKIVLAAFILAIIFCLFVLFQSYVRIPDDYIPTRWSDFSFWTLLWEQKREALRMLVQMPKTDLDAGWIQAFARTLAYGVLAEMAFFLWLGVYLLSKLVQRK